MTTWKNWIARCAAGLALFALTAPAMACPSGAHGGKHKAASAHADCKIGFLVAAPDRGFMGNEEIRDAVEAFAQRHNAALVHVTDARTRDNVQAALAALARRGATRAVVLPLYYSAGEASYATLQQALGGPGGAGTMPIEWAPEFGASYFAVEALAGQLRALGVQAGQRLIVAGTGAADAAAGERIAADLRRIAQGAAAGMGYAGVDAAVWPQARSAGEDQLRDQAQATLKEAPGAVIAQLHLGKKLDSMMAFANSLKRVAPAGSRLLAEQPLTPLALTWMQREANRRLPLSDATTGVVIAAHGSDWHWNDTMQSAARPLEQRYQVEYAFSMADAPVLERAVRRLNERGVRHIVIVRVFGTRDSFRRDIEKLIGQDIEAGGEHAQHQQAPGGGHGDHGHGSGALPPPRIVSAAVLSSAGGMEDSPLFARALVERAKALSANPAKETVILTAHGTGDDAANAKWLTLLEAIATQMKGNGGAAFRDIRVATWREDWPGKREPWIARVRGWVEEAERQGGAIVIPARTTGTGPENEFLSGLKFRLGSGFAPHPLFVRWLDQQVQQGVQVRATGALRTADAQQAPHHH